MQRLSGNKADERQSMIPDAALQRSDHFAWCGPGHSAAEPCRLLIGVYQA
jgi:hypothetical protein